MEYINIHVSVIDSQEFKGSSPVQRATWLCLMRYLAGQENGAEVENCRDWGDRKWQQVCAVTLAEVGEECGLWQWVGDDLEVNFYSLDSEKAVRSMRKGGRIGNQRRWPKNRRPDSPPDSPPDGIPASPPDSPPESVSVSVSVSGTKGEGEAGHLPTIPSDQEVAEFCTGYLGDLARGIPASIPEVWWSGWMAWKLMDVKKWPTDWKRTLVLNFRSDFLARNPKALAQVPSKSKKNGGGPDERSKSGMSDAQETFLLRKELENIQARLEACYSTGAEAEKSDQERERIVEKRLAELSGEGGTDE